MIEDASNLYNVTRAACASVPASGIVIDPLFVITLKAFIKQHGSIKGGYTGMVSDGGGMTFRKPDGTSISLTNYSLTIAYTLCPLYRLLREYEDRFNRLYSDKTSDQKLEVAKGLKVQNAAAMSDLQGRIVRLPSDEQANVQRFLTDYSWWHGEKTCNRSNDFFNSPLLSCAKLVAAANGAIPTLTDQFGSDALLYNAFKYKIVGGEVKIERCGFTDNLSEAELVAELKEMESDAETKSSAYRILGLKYPESVERCGRRNVLARAGLPTTYDVEIHKGIKLHGLIAKEKWGLSFGKENVLTSKNLISASLEAFAVSRKGAWLAQGLKVNKHLREYFDAFTERSLVALSEQRIDELFTGTHMPNGSLDLRTMWSVTGQTYGGAIDPKGDARKIQNIRDYLVRLKHDAAIASTFWADNDPLRPAGFGSSVVTELLMKFHPDEVLMYAKEGCTSLKHLGLVEFDAPNSDTTKRASEFKIIQAAGTVILSKMHAMNIDKFIKADGTGDGTAADYLTVNEFLCFVHENFQEIKNMAKQMQQKQVTQMRTAGNNDWSKLPNDNPDSLMYRLAASLLTRPFAILAGASGTGKSRMVKKLACMTCYDDDLKPNEDKSLGNYQMIQVKPSWHDSSELLGYRSMLNPDPNVVDYKLTDFVRFVLKAHAYPNTPFFVCLDEMNLAPVEQYFAEFLSACESVEKKEIKDSSGQVIDSFYVTNPLIPPTEYNDDIENIGLEYPLDQKVKDRLNKFGLYIPRNLFVVGTVNMDDTTCQFSRKVLDRAMTIEMNEVKFDTLKDPEELIVTDVKDSNGTVTKPGLLMKEGQIKAFIDRKDFEKETLDNDFLGLLEGIQEIVEPTPFAVGYRFALETSMYREALKVINAKAMQPEKLDGNGRPIPKADGSGNELVDVSGVYALDHMILTKILPRVTGNKDERKALLDGLNAYFAQKLAGHKQSADALERMLKGAESNGGYLSFWP